MSILKRNLKYKLIENINDNVYKIILKILYIFNIIFFITLAFISPGIIEIVKTSNLYILIYNISMYTIASIGLISSMIINQTWRNKIDEIYSFFSGSVYFFYIVACIVIDFI